MVQIQPNMKAAQQLLEDACSIFEKTTAMAPDSVDLYREFAMLHIKTKTEPAKAQKLAQKAVALEESAMSYYVLGLAYAGNSKPKKAVTAYQRALERDPDNMAVKRAYDSLKKRGVQ